MNGQHKPALRRPTDRSVQTDRSVRPTLDLTYARKVLASEARAVAALRRCVNESFRRAGELILRQCGPGRGRVATTGVGKAGLIARKVCATLASTGTPAFFLHPTEALHGDLGVLDPQDVLLVFSNSGESDELARLVPALKKMGVQLIALTASAASTLGRLADICLAYGRITEPCPLGLAPSASTTAMLALGDALALCVLKARGFTMRDYARLHPGGALGRKLMRVTELMRTGARLPLAGPELTVGAALDRMTQARGGAVVIVDQSRRLLGIFTDGDFRRLMLQDAALFHDQVGRHMTSPCRHMRADALVAEAQALMSEKHINALPVVDGSLRAVGLLDIQDLVGWPAL